MEPSSHLQLPTSDSSTRRIIEAALQFSANGAGMDQDAPFLVCDVGQVVAKYDEWCTALPRVKPYYAVKCNPDAVVIRTLAALGAGFDCASKQEIESVLEAGVSPARIVYANPTKMESHMLAAKRLGVNLTTFDSLTELDKIWRLDRETRLLLRIRCDGPSSLVSFGPKFGATIDAVPGLLAHVQELGLKLVGVAFHVGTESKDPLVYDLGLQLASDVFKVARAEYGFELNVVDIGGGFLGSPEPCIADAADVINSAIDAYFPTNSKPKVQVIAEPGRFFVQSAFIVVAKIHSIRWSTELCPDGTDTPIHRMHYYINEGRAGSMGVGRRVPTPKLLRPQPTSEGEVLYASTLWGPTLDSQDLVYAHVVLPRLGLGDYLYFENRGAYKAVRATTFNGFPIARVYHYVSDQVVKRLDEEGSKHGDKEKTSFFQHFDGVPGVFNTVFK